jgi:inositol-phosphate transport system substrate-binding protein
LKVLSPRIHAWRLILVLACMLFGAGCAAYSQEPDDAFCPQPPPENSSANATEVRVLVLAHRGNCWNLRAAQLAAANLPQYNLSILPPPPFTLGSEMHSQAASDYANGQGPDLYKTNLLMMWERVRDGHIIPLNSCIRQYDAFNQIRPELWPLVTHGGQVWGIPYDINVKMLFYNRIMLKRLGWSEDAIDALPQQILRQEFLLSDLIQVAEQAVVQGVTEPGYAYWQLSSRSLEVIYDYAAFGGDIDLLTAERFALAPAILRDVYSLHAQLGRKRLLPERGVDSTSNSWGDRLVRRDALAAGRVLFWQTNINEITNLMHDYPVIKDRLFEQYGAALPSAAIPGGHYRVYAGLELFVIGSPAGTGRHLQAESCALLAQMLDPHIGAQHAVTRFQVSAITASEQEPVYQTHPILPQLGAHIPQAAYFIPYGMQSEIAILTRHMFLVEQGKLAPDEAVEAAIIALTAALGDRLVIIETK